MNGVIYSRYSDGADQTDQSIEGQLRECREYADKHGITIVGVYTDSAMSGKTDKRPDFLRMIADSAKKSFEVVLVWKLDRFSRSRYDAAVYKNALKKNGVKVVSVKENIGDNPEGIILEAMLEGMAEYYSANLSQNIKRGMTESALKCKVTGGNIATGYQIGPDKSFVIDPPQAAIVREIFTMYDKGHTVSQVIKHLNDRGLRTARGAAFGHNSLHTILRNEKYIGVYKWNDVRIEGGVPAIVDRDLFLRVQEKILDNRGAPARDRGRMEYLLSLKLFCGHCGTNMNGESGTSSHKDTKHYYYKCASAKRNRGCKKRPVKKDWIEDLVVEEVVRHILDDGVIQKIAQKVVELQARERDRSILRSYEIKLEEVRKSIGNLVRAVEAGIFSESTQARLNELEAKKRDLEGLIVAEDIVTPKVTKDQVIFWLEQFKDGDVNDPVYRKKIVDVFVQAVFVYDDRVAITCNYTDESGRVRSVETKKGSDPSVEPNSSTLKSDPPPTKRYRIPCSGMRYLFYA